jgi:hypothetical protein
MNKFIQFNANINHISKLSKRFLHLTLLKTFHFSHRKDRKEFQIKFF